ncbi:hypothetical protein [Celeribacter sp.]|uniref:hypothetical protein n=1 Tax=Celeribacter sp. TaxID=1890673 RepID=UPI003A93E8D5
MSMIRRLSAAAALAFVASHAAADIQPQSGLWSGALHVVGERGCPTEIRQGLSDTFSQGGYENEQITFPDPFGPEAIAGDFKWTRTGENVWTASDKQTQKTPVGRVKLAFTHTLTVLSETQMDQRSTIEMTLPKKLANMLGVGGPCVVDSRVDHTRVGG